MVVIVNGGYRTGSTLVYNIAKTLFKSNSKRVKYQGLSDEDKIKDIIFDYALKDYYDDVMIIKSHNFLPFKKLRHVKFLYTWRNPNDTLWSIMRIKETLTKKAYLTQMDNVKKEHYRYELMRSRRDDTLMIKYEDYWSQLEKLAVKIARFFGLFWTDDVKQFELDKVKEFTDGLKEADPETEFRPGHISDTMGKPGMGENLPDEVKL